MSRRVLKVTIVMERFHTSEVDHLDLKKLIHLLVVHLSLGFGRVPDSSGISLIIVVISAGTLEIATMLSEVPHHVPSGEVIYLFLVITHVDQHSEDIIFLQFSQIGICTRDTFWVLHGWI